MNIFVTKLNYNTQEDTLRNAFEPFGAISSVKIIMDKMSGRSKGFGFVEMENDEEAHAAINALNETEIDGRMIVVKKANPKESNNDSRGGFQPRGGFRKERY
jgi:RNA recognition motif-containing protein